MRGRGGGRGVGHASAAAHRRSITATVETGCCSCAENGVCAIGSSSRSVDAIALSNGLLAGLVAITPGSDAVSVIDSIVIGVGSGVAYMMASAIGEAFYLDDVRLG